MNHINRVCCKFVSFWVIKSIRDYITQLSLFAEADVSCEEWHVKGHVANDRVRTRDDYLRG